MPKSCSPSAKPAASLDYYQFGQLLGELTSQRFRDRSIPRHHTETELAEDLDCARR